MENSEPSLIDRIFHLHTILVSPAWRKSRMRAYEQVKIMAKRQNSLLLEQVHQEAKAQAEKIRKQRNEDKTTRKG